MPKSRGRHPSKRKPPRTTQPTSYEGQAIRLAAELLKPDATRVQAELLASEALADVASLTTSEVARERRTEAIGRILTHAQRRKNASAAALLAAVQLLVQDADVQAALDEWGTALLEGLSWPTEPTPVPTRARTILDEYDDHVIWLLDYDDCIIAAATSRAFHQGVLTVSLLKTGPISPEIDRDAKPCEIETAVRALSGGQQYTEMLVPAHEDEDYVLTAALLAGRLRAIDLPEAPDVAWQPISSTDKQALLDAFFASTEGTPFEDNEDTRRLADLCLTYGDEHIDGDRLAWSPEIVEVFLLDWVPTHARLDDSGQALLPIVTYEWVTWALLERGLSAELAVEAAQVAVELFE